MKEIFKPIPGWPDYQASSLGNIKSLPRKVWNGSGFFTTKERILKPRVNSTGYYDLWLYKAPNKKCIQVHQLIAMAFLGHKPDGYNKVVNHKDFNKLNNRVDNLEIVSPRENLNQKHLKSTSKYTGVNWNKAALKWVAGIRHGNKKIHLGYFNCEIKASKAYQKKLNEIIN